MSGDPSKPCPVPTCSRRILTGYVACARHWGRVPAGDRLVLAAAFRTRTTDPVLYAVAQSEALDRVLAAAGPR